MHLWNLVYQVLRYTYPFWQIASLLFPYIYLKILKVISYFIRKLVSSVLAIFTSSSSLFWLKVWKSHVLKLSYSWFLQFFESTSTRFKTLPPSTLNKVYDQTSQKYWHFLSSFENFPIILSSLNVQVKDFISKFMVDQYLAVQLT